MLYTANPQNSDRNRVWNQKTEKAYTELAKYISNKYKLSLGRIKIGFKKYGLNGLFEKPDEFGLTEEQRDEIELIYILATKDLTEFDKAVN